jgi:hypothetical protein
MHQSGANAWFLFAQTNVPTPLPQVATPRYTVPAATARPSGMTKSG